jgi:DNA-binding CsgD family transcriptional regulator
MRTASTGAPADAARKGVLQLLAELKTNKEIATLLNLSVHTVETHRGRILQRLNLYGVPELILYAVCRGFIL